MELPLALPYIFAGLRVATATVIGLVTVTALIGLGGLGQQITYGFNIGYYTPIIVGLVLSVVLAAVGDLLLVGVQRLVVPWSRRRRPGRRGGLTWRSGTTSGISWPACSAWFTTVGQLDGVAGHPRAVLAPGSSSRWRWWSAPSSSAAGSASCSGTPAAAGWWR